MAKTDKQTVRDITPNQPVLKGLKLHLVGDTEIIINKPSVPTNRYLAAFDRKKQKVWESQHFNQWEEIITSVYWAKPIVYQGKTYRETELNSVACEDMLNVLLSENVPAFSSYGLWQSFGESVLRFGYDIKKVDFFANVQRLNPGKDVEITFANHEWKEVLLSPGFRKPKTVQYHNHFYGWQGDIVLQVNENTIKIDTVTEVVEMAGKFLGIGSSRNLGFGRYHIEAAEVFSL